MAILYTWNCSEVEAYPELDGYNNVIHSVYYMIRGMENGKHHEILGKVDLDTSSLDNFVEIEDLTSNDLTDFVRDTLGLTMVNNLEAEIAKQLHNESNSFVIP